MAIHLYLVRDCDGTHGIFQACAHVQYGPGRGFDANLEMHRAAPAARLRRGYYASVSYTDSNVGKIMEAARPVINSTVVVRARK